MAIPHPNADRFPRLAQPEAAPPADPKEERGKATPATPRHGTQIALGVLVALLMGLLAFRGYAHRFNTRPTNPAPAVALVDLNTASASELAQVPGLGPKRAEAIVDYRYQHGPFQSASELKNVPGIGPITYDRVRPYVRATAVADHSDNMQAPAAPAPPPARSAQFGTRKIQPGDPPINVNTATADELQRLPGIGPVMAQNILAARAAAPFRNVDDLDRVKGIGPKTLEKLRPLVVVK